MNSFEPNLPDNLYPMVSVIVPSFNNAQKIGVTLEGILNQNYPSFEILAIDAGSTDRTLEIINGFRDPRIRLASVSEYNRYDMINKGILLAHGTYINILTPGDFYIHKMTLRMIMALAVEEGRPSLAYCGCLLREADQDVKVLYRKMDLSLLKKGKQPTSLQSCWFHISTFQVIGKFNPRFSQRGALDLFCRFMLNGKLAHVSTKWVLTDYDLRGITRQMVICHFYESFLIVYKYFGIRASLLWFFRQSDFKRYIRLLVRSFKISTLGR